MYRDFSRTATNLENFGTGFVFLFSRGWVNLIRPAMDSDVEDACPTLQLLDSDHEEDSDIEIAV